MKLGNRFCRQWQAALCVLTVLAPAFDVLAPPKWPPAITDQPQGLVVIAGDAASFAVAATGSSPLDYQWRKDGDAIAGATATRYSLPTVTTNDAARYDVVVSNPYGTVTSAGAILTVHMPPWFTVQPADVTVSAGGNASFTASAAGIPTPGLQWYFGTAAIENADSPTLSLTNVQEDQAGTYYCMAANAARATTSAVAVLTVLAAPVITVQPASATVVAGNNVSFGVTASGTSPLSYQWLFNGAQIFEGGQFSGAAGAMLSLSNVQPANAGSYTIVVTNALGSATSVVAALTVVPPGTCVPTLAGLVGWWPGDGSARDIVGTNNGTLVDGATADAPGFVGTGFDLDGTNKYIRIPDAPELNPEEMTVECWVKWNNLDAPGTSVYVGQQYIVFKQNSREMDFEGYVLSKDRTWNDIILWEVTSAAGQLIRIDSTSPVTTNVWYHLAGVRGSNYIQLYFNGQLEAQTNVDFPQDYGDLPLYFGTSGQSYWDRRLNGVMDEVALYNRALSAEEIANLYASGVAGKCKGANGILITAQPQNQVAAPGSNVSFSVSATGADPMIYQWEFNDVPIIGATNSTLTLADVQATNAGTYTVVIVNPTGSQTSAAAILSVAGPPLLVNSQTTGEGLFAFTLNGTAGLTYLIEVSTNFQQWASLAVLTNTTGQTDFTDTTSASSRLRFYRARLAD